MMSHQRADYYSPQAGSRQNPLATCGAIKERRTALLVGSRTGAPVGRGIPTVPRFQPPPRRTQHADFPHCAPPFASLQGLWDLSYRGNFRSVVSHSIAVEQPESVIQPRPTPPLPAEALSFPSMRQLAPDLLLYPISDVGEALARVPHREVVDPPPQHWINQAYHDQLHQGPDRRGLCRPRSVGDD